MAISKFYIRNGESDGKDFHLNMTYGKATVVTEVGFPLGSVQIIYFRH